MSTSCFIIGSTRTLTSCADQLLSHGVDVRGVLSEDPVVAEWARENSVRLLDPGADLVETLSRQSFDFLFSIINFRILPPEVLALPRVGALNFHDGPLPGLAGSNIASWALYEGVARHAATWHVMTEEVDAGTVVAERWFPVRELSTALSLTYETAQVGVDLFTEMAPLIAEGRLPDPVRAAEGRKGRFFARADRMADGGIVHSGTTAAEAGRLSKAMDFGSFPNPVGVPAFVTAQDAVFVGQIRSLGRDEEYRRSTTLAVTDSQIRIAAPDADMVLSEFTTTEGDTVSGRGAAQRLGLRVGEPVPDPAEGYLEAVRTAQPGLRANEHRWRERLADLRTAPVKAEEFSASGSAYHRFELAFLPVCAEDSALVRRSFLEVLSERIGASSFDFGWSPHSAQELAERTHGLAATRVPVRFDATSPASPEEGLAAAGRWGMYATDLEVRMGLASRPPGAEGPSFTRVMVLERFREDPASVASDTELALVLPPEGVPAVFVRETAMSVAGAAEFVEEVEERLFLLLEHGPAAPRPTAPPPVHAPGEGAARTVLDLVRAVWERTPEAVAVRAGEHAITYAELDRWSAAVSSRLRERGAGEGSVVSLLTGRGPELVPSMLGVLRAGAAFLPLDPSYPGERLRTYTQSAGSTLVLTTPDLEGKAHFLGSPVLVPDPEGYGGGSEDDSSADALAYILFTSGSTGTPKGVEVAQSSLVNFLTGVGAVLGAGPQTNMLAHTTVAFDISLLELLLPLVVGATVELADEGTVADPAALAALADTVDLVQATPSLWRLLLDTGWRPRTDLVALSGGEAMPLSLARTLLDAGPELWNMYGPTEATIWVSAHLVTDLGQGFVPLGEPLPGLELHVVDEDMSPVEPGSTGALVITGAGLAEGYRGRPDLTSEVFVALPDGRRAYRTGDDVRLHTDGAVEWIGRADAQVKVRGNRIEPGEVEALLERMDQVSAAVVVAVPFEGVGDPRLTAYLVASEPPARTELDEWLSDRLPGYMVPDAYVLLDSLPLTENGKVARSRLPDPTRDNIIRAQVPAPTAEEPALLPERIAAVFARVLGHGEFGERDNFFDLGGDSNNVVRAAAALSRELGSDVASPLVFATGTPERLAAALDARPPALRQETEPVAPGTAPAEPARAGVTPHTVGETATGGEGPARPAAEEQGNALAVIGMACRFPGASTPDEFWTDLVSGTDRVGAAPAGHRGWAHLWEADDDRRGGWIEGVEYFSPERYGLSDREARRMDPLQRLLLSVTDEALESGGHDGTSLGTSTGVFVGTITSDFPTLVAGSTGHGDPHTATGTAISMVANRLSHTFGWSGPSLAVDTACSSSLVALDLAATHLLAGAVDSAVVGGANLILTPDKSRGFRRNGMLSPTGACHTFDEGADGYVRGEGCGVVVLKRLADARRDGDPVLAVVSGTSVNHSGDHSGFLTAPSTIAQQRVIREAMAKAGVTRVGYVEAHGTGTRLGDVIELESLRAVLGGVPPASVAVGSVKSAIGHLEPAAGIAGLIKTVLALQARQIPPAAHLSVPNHGFAFEDSPLYVPVRPAPWSGPAAAGVSSFGFGGVNSHAVLTAPPERGDAPEEAGPQLMVMGADSKESLRVLALRYLELLDSPHGPSLAALCSAARRRPGRSHRLACVVTSGEQLEDKLHLFLAGVERTRSLYTGAVAVDAPEQAPLPERPSPEALDRAARLFVEGRDLPRGSAGAGVRLPSTPHETRRLWLEPAKPQQRPAGGPITWDPLPESAEHIVDGRPVLPAAGYPGRAAELLGREAFRLTDMVFRAPVVSPSPLSGVHEADTVLFRDGTGNLVCEARVGEDVPPSLVEGASEGAEPVDVERMYASLAEAGLAYGPGFRCVRSLSARSGEAFGTLEGEDTAARLDPRLLDGAFQVALVACGARGLYVPFSVRSLNVFGSVAGRVRVHARLERASAGGETVTASLVVSNGAGPLAEVHELTWKRISTPEAPLGGPVDDRDGVTAPVSRTAVTEPPATPQSAVNGDRPSGAAARTPGAPRGGPLSPDLASSVIGWVAQGLEVGSEEIGRDVPLQELGMDSMLSVSMAQDLGDRLGVPLPPTLLLEAGTIDSLVTELRERYGVSSVPTAEEGADPEPADVSVQSAPPPAEKPRARVTEPAAAPSEQAEPAPEPGHRNGREAVARDVAADAGAEGAGSRDIAVIGVDGVFPGAPDMDGLWQVLLRGEDHVREVPADRWNLEEYYATDQSPGSVYLREAGFVSGWDEFDPGFFRIPPADAKWMDPQQRHLIQSAWRTLEDAGPSGVRGDLTTGVFVGASYQHYRDQVAGDVVPTAAALGNHNAILANRVSHFLDLRGPSMTIDTLCSSSLVALHQAVRSIRDGECEQALVAGVHLGLSPQYFQLGSRLRSFSPTGRSRAFDATADGFVPGEGVITLLLKPLHHALRDHDHIHTIIKGTAVNHGGRTSGLTVPNSTAQQQVITAALRDADTDPDTITLLEAHGTGTPLGDPIEIEGLTHAYRQHTPRHQYCAIGSIKTNIGHLEPAAGLAGLAKIILAMRHHTIPPTLHLHHPNPNINFETTPFYTTTQPTPWTTNPHTPRRAGLSAFGMGGVNAHIILEEPPTPPPTTPLPQQAHLLKITAPNETALRQLATDYEKALADVPEEHLGSFVRTANAGRADHRRRVVLTVTDRKSAEERLRSVVSGETPITTTHNQPPPTAFIYTGQGSQHPNMGHTLYTTEPTYQHTINHCEHLLQPHTTTPLTQLLYGNQQHLLNHTQHAQIAIVTTQVALTTLLNHWGIHPHMAIGHSLGELTAAWACGTLTLPDLLHLTATRAHHMQQQPTTGTMATITGPTQDTTQLLHHHPTIEIAAYNSPTHTTITGPTPHITQLVQQLGPTKAHLLNVSHAFHSAHMDGALTPFTNTLTTTPLTPPHTPLINGLTGTWHTPTTATNPTTWAHQIRQPVHFHTGITHLHHHGARHYWEIGPQPHLTPHARTTLNDPTTHWHTTLRKNQPEQRGLYQSVEAYLNAGIGELDWAALHEGKGQRTVIVPGYPFTAQKLSAEAPRLTAAVNANGRANAHPLFDSRDE